MKHQVRRIRNKPNDYKICNKCKGINWYENIKCTHCPSKEFDEDTASVKKAIAELDKFMLLEV